MTVDPKFRVDTWTSDPHAAARARNVDQVLATLERHARSQERVLGPAEAAAAARVVSVITGLRDASAKNPECAAHFHELLTAVTSVLGKGWEKRARRIRSSIADDEFNREALKAKSLRQLAGRLGRTHAGVRKYIEKKMETEGFRFPPDVAAWLERHRRRGSKCDEQVAQVDSSE